MSSLQKSNQELIEYFDHVSAQLTSDYEHVREVTNKVINHPKADEHQKAELAWALSHLTRDAVALHQTIKNYQRILKDAS